MVVKRQLTVAIDFD